MSQLRYWVWLASVDGVRPITLCRMAEHFGGPMEAYFALEERLDEIDGITPQERKLLADRNLERTERILAVCQQKGIRILTLNDASYPDRLRQIADPQSPWSERERRALTAFLSPRALHRRSPPTAGVSSPAWRTA